MRARLGFWFDLAVVLALAVCIAWLSTRFGLRSDWTHGARASLPPSVAALLKQLPGPLSVTSYASPGSGLRPRVAAFIARYQALKPDLALHFVDPETDPAAMREAGIQVDGELVVTWQDHSRHLTQLADASFANTLARLARGGERLVAFVGGDGERRPAGQANADLGHFAGSLSARGLRALNLNLATTGQVPQNTDLVVLASPLVALPPAAVQALRHWLDGGGNLLWLTEPDSRALGLAPLASALGVRVLPGVLVDGGGAKLGLTDPRNVAVGSYPTHAITTDFQLTTVFPQVAALAVVSGSTWQAHPILSSGPQSWNERQPITGTDTSTIAWDEAGGELRGPLDFGLALSRARPGQSGGEQRVVVIGDGDFLSNSFVGNGGNASFGRRVFDWLLGDDQLVSIPPRPAPDRQLALSQTGLNRLAFGLLLGLPLTILALTGFTAWRRRRG